MGTQSGSMSIAASNLAATIDKLDIAYETEMLANADATMQGTNDLRQDLWYQLDVFAGALKTFAISLSSILLNPNNFSDTYTSTMLDKFNTVLDDFVNETSLVTIEGVVGNSPTITLDENNHDNEYAVLFDSTIVPSDYSTAYSVTLATLLSTYINAAGTGLDSTVETAMYNRARARILSEANRNARRITTQLMMRMPYGGELIDALAESDQDVVNSMSDVNNKIVEEQGRLTYQAALDRIEKALIYEKDLAANYYKAKDLKLQATTNLDEFSVKEDNMKLTAHDSNAERYLQADKSKNELAVRRFEALIQKARVMFETRRNALDAIADMEKINSGHYEFMKDLKLRADVKLDELTMQNHWTYFEACLKSFLAYWDTIMDYLKGRATSEEQIKFENYVKMSDIAQKGQLNISALIANMTQ